LGETRLNQDNQLALHIPDEPLGVIEELVPVLTERRTDRFRLHVAPPLDFAPQSRELSLHLGTQPFDLVLLLAPAPALRRPRHPRAIAQVPQPPFVQIIESVLTEHGSPGQDIVVFVVVITSWRYRLFQEPLDLAAGGSLGSLARSTYGACTCLRHTHQTMMRRSPALKRSEARRRLDPWTAR
jgi:hypothetical protein